MDMNPHSNKLLAVSWYSSKVHLNKAVKVPNRLACDWGLHSCLILYVLNRVWAVYLGAYFYRCDFRIFVVAYNAILT